MPGSYTFLWPVPLVGEHWDMAHQAQQGHVRREKEEGRGGEHEGRAANAYGGGGILCCQTGGAGEHHQTMNSGSEIYKATLRAAHTPRAALAPAPLHAISKTYLPASLSVISST